MKSLTWMAGGTALAWSIAAVAGWQLQGEAGFWQATAAMALCLLPALATLVWSLSADPSPESQLVAVLGGVGIRLAAVLAGGFLMQALGPAWFSESFWVWLGVFYLYTLTLETLLLVRHKSQATS